MNLYLFDEEEIVQFELPIKKIGNFWMKDSKDINVVNIVANNNTWYIYPNKNDKIYDSKGLSENITLKCKSYYILEKNNKKYLLYCDYLNDNTFDNYIVNDNTTIKVGKDLSNEISIPINNIKNIHITLNFKDAKWNLKLEENAICYLNNKKVDKPEIKCNNCDLINIYGIKILLVNGYIFVNNPFNNITIHNLEKIDFIIDDKMSNEEIVDEDLYKDEDYFLKSPRIIKNITTFEMNIDSPPKKEEVAETPLWVTLAPMLTMSASSMVTLSNAIMSVIDGEKTFKNIIPSLVICISMLLTMLVWPFVTKKLEKKNREKKEADRQVLYQKYIDKKDKELAIEYENQKRALQENILSTDVCYDMITNKRRILWSRRIDQDDFLKLRVGVGSVLFDSKINYHKEDFSMDDDNLKLMLEKLINFNKEIDNVPISYSFMENILTCINGVYPKYITFTYNLLLQAMAFHSYDDLKFVVFTNKKNKSRWEFLYNSPYCFSNDKTIRFVATNTEEMQEISNYLGQILSSRQVLANDKDNVLVISKYNNEHYFIIIDDIDKARRVDIIEKIIDEKRNFGFNIIILEEKLSKVPGKVEKNIIIGDKTSTILNTVNNSQIKFIEETNDTYDMNLCIKLLSNIPVQVNTVEKQLPNSLTFLELFGVGNIEQLNVLNRWKENNPTKTLRTPIGLNVVGDPFFLDLHEKQHGPHGLIAGMTGSGKSELIITYVLSMAVNYSPEEVAFVLIDYKGGGLSGAFVNNETGKKLPHVVGTITNLDKTEISRALASIKSELRRRQEIFNEVRKKTGEGTIDIYKYQRMYRDGIINEPMPHLIIVSDEFAELKQQQPDFMEDLISTARIGRSLGVHLILATQKPSGIVDGQIWANSKFKICLKVQDKQDSMEMIRNDLAAEIKNVGRFYLLIGYSEFFSTGQSAWTGAQYYPNNEFKKTVDRNLYIINTTGSIDKTVSNIMLKQTMISNGEELTNIVNYLINIDEEHKSIIKQLWLDKMPQFIYLDNIIKKYNYTKQNYYINPVIGEYDNPFEQKQGLVTINFEKNGNTLIYGMNSSGKDELLQTITYSLLKNYTTDELNLYILDFGAETLNNFANAPQVGDVALNGDDEKINNLYKLLNEELVKRKKIFANYGGNYRNYIENCEEKIPLIVVEINSIEALTELYANFADNISVIIRDGSKYGIYFVITTETPNSVKMKIAQCCKNIICLQLSNDTSYRDLLGKTDGLVPSQYLGRGLIKMDRVCEFQTAYFANEKNSYEFINNFINELNSLGYKKAPRIKVMPDIIKTNELMSLFRDLSMTPIGIVRESLNVSLYDFKKKNTSVISSSEIDSVKPFVKNLLNEMLKNGNVNVQLIDAQKLFKDFKINIPCYTDNFNNIVDSINKYNDVILERKQSNTEIILNKENIFFIIGISKFYSKLDDEHKKMFNKVLTDNKDFPYVHFVFVDVPSEFKKYEYEEWYKYNFDLNNGIWIGPGLSQQFLIKVLNQLNSFSSIENNYGIVVKNGVASVVKLINEIKN